MHEVGCGGGSSYSPGRKAKIVRSDTISDGLDLEEPTRDENKDSEVIYILVANSYSPSSCYRDGDNFAVELLACTWLLGTWVLGSQVKVGATCRTRRSLRVR